MCKSIKVIYKSILGDDLNSSELEDQIKAQKLVYLIENKGIMIGDYSFVWGKYGPYSCDLQRDILSGDDNQVEFSKSMKKAIEEIKECIENRGQYSKVHFLELLASLHYIRKLERFGLVDYSVALEEVKIRKPHLNNEADNVVAINILKHLIA